MYQTNIKTILEITTLKLYFKPGACSLASHIILEEIGNEFETELVDTVAGKTASNVDFKLINPKGYVPALTLDPETILTEGPAILQYLADKNPNTNLIPPVGSLARTRVQEYLGYINSELHKAFTPLFKSDTGDDGKKQAKINVADKFNYLNLLLSDGRNFLLGNQFTVADAYLFVVSNWSHFVGIPLNDWPHLAAFISRVAERPASKRAMTSEGLI